MTGNQRRCREDEKLINAALGSSGQKGYIIDTRTQNLAMTAKVAGRRERAARQLHTSSCHLCSH